jgi:hypothetical protein
MSQKMQLSDLLLRCFTLKRGKYWVAMCVDLDLTVQADTSTQARQLLSEQIHSYITDALSVDAQHVAKLLKRQAPWRFRMLYQAMVVLKTAHVKWANMSQYIAPIPLIPATP